MRDVYYFKTLTLHRVYLCFSFFWTWFHTVCSTPSHYLMAVTEYSSVFMSAPKHAYWDSTCDLVKTWCFDSATPSTPSLSRKNLICIMGPWTCPWPNDTHMRDLTMLRGPDCKVSKEQWRYTEEKKVVYFRQCLIFANFVTQLLTKNITTRDGHTWYVSVIPCQKSQNCEFKSKQIDSKFLKHKLGRKTNHFYYSALSPLVEIDCEVSVCFQGEMQH